MHAKDYYLYELLEDGNCIKVQKWSVVLGQTDLNICLKHDKANDKINISADQDDVEDLNFSG